MRDAQPCALVDEGDLAHERRRAAAAAAAVGAVGVVAIEDDRGGPVVGSRLSVGRATEMVAVAGLNVALARAAAIAPSSAAFDSASAA